jgi:hypothetical protein
MGWAMAPDVSTRTSNEVVRRSLISLSGHLEPLWREAGFRLRDLPARSADRARWDTAAARLTDALRSLEDYAGAVDPTLGRRDWTTRRPSRVHLPPQRVPSAK